MSSTDENDSARETFRQGESYRLLVEGVKDYAIFMLDPTGRIVSWNPGVERIKGYAAEEVIGKHFSLFYTEKDLQRGHPQHELEVATAEGRFEEEGWRVRKDGSTFWANVVITALFDEDRRLVGFAKVTRDLTERKRAEEDLRRLNQELERRVEERTRQLAEVNQELESFCYTVSHDLRAPLRGMLGFAEALMEDYGDHLDPEAADYIHRIARASRRMELLINDLLEFSRLSREDVRPHPLSLKVAIDEALSQVSGEVQGRAASVTVTEPFPSVMAHRGTLVRVVANLLSNAVKFVEPDKSPVVRVYTEGREDRVRLWVEDNGIGVKPEHRERIFRVFERLHGVETYPGTGIGLAIVRKGMERMGGAAGVESEPGKGSRFWVELDRAGEMNDRAP